MTLQQKIPIIPQPAVASYDFFDIEERTGVQIFYGYATTDNGTVTYGMTRQTPYSDYVFTKGSTANLTDTKLVDIDFDLKFNLPQILKGIFKAQIPFIGGLENTAGLAATHYVVMKVRHWDGSTETELASNTKSKVLTVQNSSTAEGITAFCQAELTTPTHFKSGESLRITIELWGDGTSTNGSIGAILHDPKDRTFGSTAGFENNGDAANSGAVYESGGAAFTVVPETTQIVFYIPFSIDIQ